MMSAAKSRAPAFIGGQEFDDAEPVLLILPVRLEIVFVLRSQDRQTPFPTFWLKTRDTQSVGSFVFPIAIYRALRCDRSRTIKCLPGAVTPGTHRGHNKVFLAAPRTPSSASVFL